MGIELQLSLEVQHLFRTSYGILLLLTLFSFLPHLKRFFLSERWGGYGESRWDVEAIQNPVVLSFLIPVWFACALSLTLGSWTPAASLINFLICRYYFIGMRWKGISRGLGAPGFITCWVAAAVFLLETSLHHFPAFRNLAVFVLQIDFAFIMLSSGIYKFKSGYPKNEGMEYGMTNPEWGYWWSHFSKQNPDSLFFKFLNHCAWVLQITAAVCMFLPPARFLGGVLIILGFGLIATQIRLGLLCEMVMLCGILFFHPGSAGGHWIQSLYTNSLAAPSPASVLPFANSVFAIALMSYLVLLPLAYAGLFYNFYGKRSLPKFLQQSLEAYTNFFGIILWRVFSVDVINFFIRIYRIEKGNLPNRTLISKYGWRGGLRFSHVGECITITSLFTTLKYYPSNFELFRERLLRYSKTLVCGPGQILVFEYLSIQKKDGRFLHVPVAEFEVDPAEGSVKERILNKSISVRKGHAVSLIHETARPGSYAPLETVSAAKD